VEKLMKRITLLGTILGAMVMFAASCGGSSGGSSGSSSANSGGHAKGNAPTTQESTMQASYSPSINPSDFTTTIDNKYFPLKPGTTFFYDGGAERDEFAVTHSTKKVMGVECVVVNDKAWENGKLIEQTYDWHAQDKKGNVWYFGEDTKEYKNGKVVSTKGSWEAGVDGAKPGIIMQAHPKVGQSYRQEYYKGEAEDMAKAISLNESVRVPFGSFDGVLETKEWTPLEPGYVEHKYYAAEVGQVYGGGLELVDVKHS
jgi:hypothetical protein